jgi:hypothetical protein
VIAASQAVAMSITNPDAQRSPTSSLCTHALRAESLRAQEISRDKFITMQLRFANIALPYDEFRTCTHVVNSAAGFGGITTIICPRLY